MVSHHVETWDNHTDTDMKISVQGKQLDVGDDPTTSLHPEQIVRDALAMVDDG